MSILAWIVLGLISGFIASKIVNKQGEGVLLDIVLGVVGALVGGWLFAAIGHSPSNGSQFVQHFCFGDRSNPGFGRLPRTEWRRPKNCLGCH